MLQVPIALGRDFSQLPETLGDQAVSRVELNDRQVSRFHALLTFGPNRQLIVVDRSANGTSLNGRSVRGASQPLGGRDTLKVGPYKILVTQMSEGDKEATELNFRDPKEQQAGLGMSGPLTKVAIGAAILVVMGAAAWLVVSFLLNQYSPQVPEESDNVEMQESEPDPTAEESPTESEEPAEESSN